MRCEIASILFVNALPLRFDGVKLLKRTAARIESARAIKFRNLANVAEVVERPLVHQMADRNRSNLCVLPFARQHRGRNVTQKR